MNVEHEVNAGNRHAPPYVVNLRTAFFGRLLPFAVQVGAGRVGAQVAAAAAVRVHVRHDIDVRGAQDLARDGILLVEQPVEESLHPPFGHGLARMLTGKKPASGPLAFAARVANDQQIEVVAIDGPTRHLQTGAWRPQAAGDQPAMPRHRIGREIGEMDRVEIRSVGKNKLAPVVFGRHAEP